MKKLILLCACMAFLSQAKSQVLNPGFETLDTTNMPSNWGPFGFLVMPVDSNCGWVDTMQLLSHDAHSGNYAYEMRVATYCSQANGGTLKTIRFTNVDTFADQREPFTNSPAAFTFWYKFNSAQGDKLFAEAYLEEQDGTPVAEGTLTIQQPAGSWTLGTIPMTYVGTNAPEYVRLQFRFLNDTLHYGTRATIDDINEGFPASVAEPTKSENLVCYPVPVKDVVFIEVPGGLQNSQAMLCISDAMGRVVRMDEVKTLTGGRIQMNMADLPQGTYFLKLWTGTNIFTGRFLK